MKSKFKDLLIVLALSLIPTLLIWVPFILRLPEFWSIPLPVNGMQTIAANFDGPLYIVVAKTFYNTTLIKEGFSFPLQVQYYAAHFPFFPLLIWVAGTLLNLSFGNTFGFPWGMLTITLITSVITIYYFKAFVSQYVHKKDLIWITFVFAVFPARWLIVRSVGTPEPLFIGAILASIFHFQKKQYWASGIWGALAQLTKSPGILLFLAYGLYILLPSFKSLAITNFSKWTKTLPWGTYPIILIPMALLGTFYLYNIQYQDFFAYFNSGDNIHLLFPPFRIFDYSQPWTGTFWLEEVIFVYFLGALGIVKLYHKKLMLPFWFTLIFFTSTIFVTHRDIVRYSLPTMPFILVAFSDTIVKREFKIAFAAIIIPIYLFSLAFIANNVMPISDWTPLI